MYHLSTHMCTKTHGCLSGMGYVNSESFVQGMKIYAQYIVLYLAQESSILFSDKGNFDSTD